MSMRGLLNQLLDLGGPNVAAEHPSHRHKGGIDPFATPRLKTPYVTDPYTAQWIATTDFEVEYPPDRSTYSPDFLLACQSVNEDSFIHSGVPALDLRNRNNEACANGSNSVSAESELSSPTVVVYNTESYHADGLAISVQPAAKLVEQHISAHTPRGHSPTTAGEQKPALSREENWCEFAAAGGFQVMQQNDAKGNDFDNKENLASPTPLHLAAPKGKRHIPSPPAPVPLKEGKRPGIWHKFQAARKSIKPAPYVRMPCSG